MMPTIRELREQRGWRQADLAEQLGVAPVTVARWEQGEFAPDVPTQRLIAMLFGIEPSTVEVPLNPQKRARDQRRRRKTPAPEEAGAGSASSESAEEAKES